MKMKPKDILPILKQTYHEWSEDKAPRLGAALAYYAIFSIAPLLLLAIRALAVVYGGQASDQVYGQLHNVVGDAMAKNIQGLVSSANTKPGSGQLATIVGTIILLAGASGVFVQLQDALNTIWEVAPRPGLGLVGLIKERAMSFVVVLGTGFLLLISLLLSAAIQAAGKFAGTILPVPVWVMDGANFLLSFAIITALFALIFKELPDAEVRWSDVWIGAAITALLFTIGKQALGLYLGRSGMASAYGAAGSLVAILFWVYYAAQIIFFGAEFTQVYANKFGSHVVPSDHAVKVTEVIRARQGMPRLDDLKQAAKEGAPGNTTSNGSDKGQAAVRRSPGKGG